MLASSALLENKSGVIGLSLKKFEKEMNDAGVYSTSVNKYTIDEAPECYKDTELIKQLVEPSVEILEHLRPILNVKG